MIEAFVESYRCAFEAYDVPEILRHFVFPCHIVSDADAVALMPLASEAECRQGVERVLALHREIGMRTGRARKRELHEFSPHLMGMSLDYVFCDAAGRDLYDFQGFYTLVRGDDGWRIAAISHNQIPRLLRCAADRRRGA
jgi:hypothetical protein